MPSLAVQYLLRLYVSEQFQAKKIQSNQRSGRPLLLYALNFDEEEDDVSPLTLLMVADLLKHGALPNAAFEGNLTPWEMALTMQDDIEGWIGVCELMLEHGADVYKLLRRRGRPKTALYIALDYIARIKVNLATRKRLANLIATSLRLGADPHERVDDDRTPLDTAKRCYPEIREVVLKQVEEQESRKRNRSVSPTGQESSGSTRALTRQKRSHVEDRSY